MRFGIAFSNRKRGLVEKLSLLGDIVVKAEELGYDSFLTTDHYMLPWGNETFETWVYLSYLAGKVSSIRLGTCVTPISFRPPSLLAKTISTLDLVSNGRVIVGVGLGWYQDEFEAYSSWDPNPVRFEKTREALELMVKLWSEDKVDFEGNIIGLRAQFSNQNQFKNRILHYGLVVRVKKCLDLQRRWGMGG